MKRENSRKNSIIKLRIYVCLLFLVAVFMDVTQYMTYKDNKGIIKEPVFSTVLFLLIYLSYKSMILVREGGKVVCGKISGYDFVFTRIGRIFILNNIGKKKVKRLSYAVWGGQTIMAPHEYKDGDYPYLLYNYGGAISCILYYALAALILLPCKDLLYAGAFLKSLSVFALIIIIKEVIVSAKNKLNVMKNSETRRCFYSWAKMNYLLSEGVRFKDMDENLFAMPDNDYLADHVCALIGAVNIDRALDKLDIESARQYALHTLKYGKGLAAGNRNVVKLQLIFCDLLSGDRDEELAELLDEDMKKLLKSEVYISEAVTVQYAYSLFYEHDNEEAEKYLDKFNESLKDCTHDAKVKKETEIIKYVRDRHDNKIYGRN